MLSNKTIINTSSESSNKHDSESYSDTSSSDNESYVSLSEDDVVEHEDNLQLEGSILNIYNILSELGRGSYSIVWLAYNIENSKYYAIKVQSPNNYKDGKNENEFMRKLPNNLNFNRLLNDFTEIRDNKKFLCSVYELHCANLDCVIRKSKYKTGLPELTIKTIMIQLLEACNYLHTKLKVYHGDIKTDNILLQGKNKKVASLIELYNQMNFNEIYLTAKKEYLPNKLTSVKKHKLRTKLHSEIYNKVITVLNEYNIDKYDIDEKYIMNCNVNLADFGSFVEDGEYYDETFGTRYYRSPENILIGKSSYPNDIWALGCTFYELITGTLLFDPIKDKVYDRDDYHLKLINECCGDFNPSFLKNTKFWKRYFNSSYKLKIAHNLGYTNKIENTIGENNVLLPIVKGMLKINPKERLTASMALELINKI